MSAMMIRAQFMMTSQFGSGNKNPPWARQATDFMAASGMAGQSQVSSGLVQQPGLASNPTLYSYNSQAALQQQQYAAQQQLTLQNQAAGLSQPGLAMPTTLGGGTTQAPTISYPSARPTQTPSAAGVGASQKQRVFTGTVTKLHENFGFIDEDVFFQTNCVKGVTPKVGDRVFVEASYNAAMPFKWNATRVQVLSGSQPMTPQNTGLGANAAAAMSQQQQLNAMQQAAKMIGQGAMGGAGGGAAGLLGGVNPLQLAATVSAISNASNLMGSLANRSGLGNRGRGMMRGSRVGRSNFSNESRFSEDRESVRERERERDRREKRDSRRRSRSSSPASRTRTSRSPKRRSRPPPRYVVQAPRFVLTTRDASVMTLRSKYTNMYVPSDFFSAGSPWIDNLPMNRSFVLGQQCKFHIMHKEVGPLTPITAVLDPPDADHKFCAKVMLLTSPNLGELYSKTCGLAQDDPESQESFQHPTRLLQFLVGTRGKNEPMAIGGPWSPSLDGPDPEDNPQVLIKTAIRCTKALTGIDLSKCTQWYRFAEIRYLRAESRDKPARVETVVLFLPDVWRCAPSRLDWMTLQKSYALKLQKKLNPDAVESEEPQEGAEPKKEPTHFSQLDPKTLKLQELRDELDSRTLSSKGLKSQLIARLTKALLVEEEADFAAKAQKEKEEEEKKAKEEEEEKEKEKKDSAQKKEEEEQERKKKKERQLLEKRYALPESPAIVVHPSPTAKSGKFDCSIMTLSVLLDYRPEDNKEHSFEVSLFAELFNEMLMRDFGFTIYKALAAAPPKVEDEKKKKDSKEKDAKDKDKKSEEPPAKKKKSDDNKKDDEDGDGDQEMEDEEEDKVDSGKEDDEKDKKDGKRDKVKLETVDPALLLACVYYDQNHCGYVLERDLEDIIFSLGLDLSRAQVRKLVQKVLIRESFYYRKLCDQPMVKEGETAPDNNLLPIDPDVLAKGNLEYRVPTPSGVGATASPRGGKSGSGGGKETEFVTFRGSVVDLESLMEKLEGSDQSRALLEGKLVDMTSEMGTVKASLSSQEAAVKSVKQELTSTQARLQVEITQRTTMEAQRLQWEAAVREAKVALTQATSVLATVLPDKVKKEEASTTAEQEKAGKKNGEDSGEKNVKEEASKKEKS
ncbi:cell division cycle and apoptosis regulator protein 1-like isoform X2 [Babylonia areolata]|uniref:cell division cycle and apoptosis regulator protein 1-like isoform X2 n=1 Tax=Babylonia areolata TaxID=304850 RepID=UPI003FD2FDAF